MAHFPGQTFQTDLTLTQNNRFQPCKPQIVQLGDIVQAQLSFVIISVKGGKCKMLMILHLLVLLESKFTKVCEQSTTYLTFTMESAQVTKLEMPKNADVEA